MIFKDKNFLFLFYFAYKSFDIIGIFIITAYCFSYLSSIDKYSNQKSPITIHLWSLIFITSSPSLLIIPAGKQLFQKEKGIWLSPFFSIATMPSAQSSILICFKHHHDSIFKIYRKKSCRWWFFFRRWTSLCEYQHKRRAKAFLYFLLAFSIYWCDLSSQKDQSQGRTQHQERSIQEIKCKNLQKYFMSTKEPIELIPSRETGKTRWWRRRYTNIVMLALPRGATGPRPGRNGRGTLLQ